MNQRHAEIISTAVFVPKNEVTNDALRKRFVDAPNFVDKIEASSGIRTRWVADEGTATSDLAFEAAKRALDRAGLSPEDVDLIVLGTDSPDYITPATSVLVQDKLGARRAGTFDVGCACASFPTGLAVASGLMHTNAALRHVLVIGAYRMSKLADPTDPMSFFYGDGAGAAVLRASEAPGVLGAAFAADGAYAHKWGIYSGGTAEPASEDSVRAGRTQVRLLDRYPPEVNEEGWPKLVHRLCKEQSIPLREVDLFLFTQVRQRTIEKVMTRLEMPMEKTHMVMQKWGYTGSACIPMVLHDAIESGRLQPGNTVVMVGSGVGYNQAAVAMRATEALVRAVQIQAA